MDATDDPSALLREAEGKAIQDATTGKPDNPDQITRVEQVSQSAATRDEAAVCTDEMPVRPTEHYSSRAGWPDAANMVAQTSAALDLVKERHNERITSSNEADRHDISPDTDEPDLEQPSVDDESSKSVDDYSAKSSAEKRMRADERAGRNPGEITEAQQAKIDRMMGSTMREVAQELTRSDDGISRGGRSLGGD